MKGRPRRRTGGPSSPDRSATGREPGDEGTGSGPGGVPPGRARAAPSHLVIALADLREPIVVILLIIGFMSWISGKPLDGLLILLAGACLAWDAGRRSRQAGPAEASSAAASPTPVAMGRKPWPAGAYRAAGLVTASTPWWSAVRRSLVATAAVAGFGASSAVGEAPATPPAPPRPPAAGLAVGAVFVAGCL
jgi:hypothetical protein